MIQLSISHIFHEIYGCFDLSGSCHYQGEFKECQKFIKGEPIKTTKKIFTI